jgi:hypothetical protein
LACRNGHTETCQHFLRTNESALAYTEQHDFEYGKRDVYPVVLEKINALKDGSIAFMQRHSDKIFDIDREEASYFFMW